ncbi:hypothetical protein ACFPAF_13340 [Hymenobacter endophyticus]|uniref:Uncharacterized protein n=1 Tax=Hymenobacter endophyticus TaxID=3076335 RepID=A0ABU3TJ29_9BACT|nr:hypothetical protein [Hymenobacter endophyticus]MDU0371386.1 hypothetical protein [Hymenobacter endophyticus]
MFIWLLATVPAGAQITQLDTLYARTLAGNRPALEKVVRLTKSRQHVRYQMGRHQRKSRLGKLAASSLQDLVVFSVSEQGGQPLDFSRTHLALVRSRMSDLRYFPVYKQWGLSRLEDDSSSVHHLRQLPPGRVTDKVKPPSALAYRAAEGRRLDSLWQARSPLLLRELPRYVYWHRDQGFLERDMVTFMEHTTGLQVGVHNYTADTVYSLAYDFRGVALRNYTVFWARHYHYFSWNQQKGRFEAPALPVRPRSAVQQLLDQIAGSDSSAAFQAYTAFIEQNIQVPSRNMDELTSFFPNRALPIFWEKFIRSKQAMRAYLRQKGLPLTLPPALQQQSLQLLQPLPFGQRYQLENHLISVLNPEQITAFELLMLDYSRNDAAQESVGRILDVWYSRNWPQVTGSEKQLGLYLKKISAYKGLGIVGGSNSFAHKLNTLRGQPRRAVRHLAVTAPDAEVQKTARMLLRPHWSSRSRRTFSRVRPASSPARLFNADSLRQVLLGRGLQVYPAGKLSVARIDTALKYDAPLGFVGGHTPRTTTLEPLIRLLEAEFHTDLGFGPAFGDWRLSGSPSVVHRARAWRWYLRRQGLLGKDTDPISFVQKNSFHSRSPTRKLKWKIRRFTRRLFR